MHSRQSCTVSGQAQSAVKHNQQSSTVSVQAQSAVKHRQRSCRAFWVAVSAQQIHQTPQIFVARLCTKLRDRHLAQQELLVTQGHTVGVSDSILSTRGLNLARHNFLSTGNWKLARHNFCLQDGGNLQGIIFGLQGSGNLPDKILVLLRCRCSGIAPCGESS